jgi:mRNA interferase HigB
VFGVKRADQRRVIAAAYRFGAVCVKFIGTHADDDRIDADTLGQS